ncbi:MAG: hypothetical protein M4579_003396 [Chaenotheca gracillima]|nr:MAG: hypothetical protein M4579_003396 [Chaenotheca gracillima]
MCLRLAIDLRWFEILAQKSPRSTAELARLSDCDESLVVRFMRNLAPGGFVSEVGTGLFAATSLTRALTKPHVQAGVIHWYDQSLPVLATAPSYFKKRGYRPPESSTAGPLQFANGTSLDTYQYWETLPGVIENFNTFMEGHFAGKRLSWLEWFPLKQRVIDGASPAGSSILFVDVGGGRGHEAKAVKTEYPHAPGRIVLQDLPHVVEDVRDNSIEVAKYNFFEPQPLQGARAYFLSNILHNWCDEESLVILRNLAAAMTPKYSKLLIADLILPNTGCTDRAVGMDIGMLVLHSGTQRSQNAWKELLSKVGLTILKFWTPPGQGEGDGIIEVVKDE